MINFKYLTSGNEERIYDYLNNLSNCKGCFCSRVYFRFIHAVYGVTAVDIYVNNVLAVGNLSYSQISDYTLYNPGNCTITVYPANSKTNIMPILTKTFDLAKNTAYNIAIAGNEKSFDLYPIKEFKDETPSVRQSTISFTNLAPFEFGLDLYLAGKIMLFRDVKFLQTMPNIVLVPTEETFEARATGSDKILGQTDLIYLRRNTYYSLFAIPSGDRVKLIILSSGLNFLDLC